MPRARNMKTRKGTIVPNQIVITTSIGDYFQSYDSLVAFKPKEGPVQLGPSWNCSVTTSKYRAQFLGESTAETQSKLDSGVHVLSPELD